LNAPAPKASKRGFFEKGLNILSSTLLEPTTLLTKGFGAAERKVAKRRADITRTKDISKALDVVGETLTSTALIAGAVLGGGTVAGRALVAKVAPKLIPKTPKSILLTATGTGILTTSKSARKFVGGILQDPTKTGREAGLLLDRTLAGKEDDSSFVDIAKKAGVAGVVIAGVAGGLGLASKFKNRDKTPDGISRSPTSIIGGLVPTPLSELSPDPVIAKKEKPALVSAPAVNIKINNKPQVNVAVAQSL